MHSCFKISILSQDYNSDQSTQKSVTLIFNFPSLSLNKMITAKNDLAYETCQVRGIITKGPTLSFPDIHLLDITNVLFLQTLLLLLSTLCMPCHLLLGSIIINPGFIPHFDAIKEVLSYAVIMFQVIQAGVHTRAPSLFCQLPEHKLCGNKVYHTLLKTMTLG